VAPTARACELRCVWGRVYGRERVCGMSSLLVEANMRVELTGHVLGSCWVCQRMRTHSGRVITAGLVRSVISTLGS
jgi:hypothetical protein